MKTVKFVRMGLFLEAFEPESITVVCQILPLRKTITRSGKEVIGFPVWVNAFLQQLEEAGYTVIVEDSMK